MERVFLPDQICGKCGSASVSFHFKMDDAEIAPPMIAEDDEMIQFPGELRCASCKHREYDALSTREIDEAREKAKLIKRLNHRRALHA